METIITQPTTPDINEIVRIYAKEKGLSDTAAWALIRGTFVPRSEVLNIIESQNRIPQGTQQPRIAELMAQKNETSMEKLRIDLEIKRMEMQEKAEIREQRRIEIEEAKLALDEKIEMRKLELDEKRQMAKEEFNQQLLLLQSGKKPEEALEKFYEKLFDAKSEHIDELSRLRASIEEKASKGDSSAQDFIKRMDEYNKMQETVVKSSLGILKARGFSEEEIEKVRKQAGLEENKGGTVEKLWGLGKLIWKDYVEPAAEKASKELNTVAPSGLEINRITPEVEKRIREETEAKAKQMEEENKLLRQQYEEEKKRIQILQEERRKLEYRATELGIPFDDTTTNSQLFYQIENQEAALEQAVTIERQVTQDREQRARRAIVLQEAAIPQEVKHETEIQDTIAQDRIIPARLPSEPEYPQAKATINIQEELAKPHEVSEETQEFMKEVDEIQARANKLDHRLEGSRQEVEVQQPDQPDIILNESEEPEDIETGKAGKQKKQESKPKGRRTFNVYKENGEYILGTTAQNHKSAALGVTLSIGGSSDNPIRVKVSDESGDERCYDTFCVERKSKHGKKFMAPRIRAVR